jgi:hypothetical protein
MEYGKELVYEKMKSYTIFLICTISEESICTPFYDVLIQLLLIFLESTLVVKYGKYHHIICMQSQ